MEARMGEEHAERELAMSETARGRAILTEAENLVVDVLKKAPRGLTNSDIGRLTGLNPPLKRQRGYITWSVLQDLLRRGIVERVDDHYRLAASA